MTSFRTTMLLKKGDRGIPQRIKWPHPNQAQDAAQAAFDAGLVFDADADASLDTLYEAAAQIPSGKSADSLLTDSHEPKVHSSYVQDTQSAMAVITQSTARPSAVILVTVPQTPSTLSVSHASKETSPDSQAEKTTTLMPALETGHLLSSDTALRPLTTHAANSTATYNPPSQPTPAHGTRKVVLACVLGGVLGLVGCSIIGFCIFNFTGWYKSYKKRRSEQNLSPSLSPLEKMDSNDPLAHIDKSIEVRRGSMVYISSPLEGDNILRLKGLPPPIPQKNPRRQASPRTLVAEPKFYEFRARPEIHTPRRAPPPPGVVRPSRGASPLNSAEPLNEPLQPVSSPIAEEDAEPRSDYPKGGPSDGVTTVGTSAALDNGIEPKEEARIHESPITANHDLLSPTGPVNTSQKERESYSSSCYSTAASRKLETPLADLRLKIGRTSRSSFAGVTSPLASRFEESNLATIKDVSLMEEEPPSITEEVNDTNETLFRSPSPAHAEPSSPEIYDDGKGSYPVLALELEDDPKLSDTIVPITMMSSQTDLDSLDLFA